MSAQFTTRRRLSPHTRNLHTGLREIRVCYDWPPFKSEGPLFCGSGVILPAGADPSEFSWQCVAGRYVFLFAQPGVGRVIPESVVRAAFREFGLAGAIAVCCWTGRQVIFSPGLIAEVAA